MMSLRDERTQYGWYNPVGWVANGYESAADENSRLLQVAKIIREEAVLPGMLQMLIIMELMRQHS